MRLTCAALLGIAALLGVGLRAAPTLGDEPTALIDDDTLAVVRVDLARLDFRALGVWFEGEARAAPALAEVARRADALRAQGVAEVYLLFGTLNSSGLPTLAIQRPAAPSPDPQVVRALDLPPELLTTRLVRGWTVVGVPAVVARLHETQPVARPDLMAALRSGDQESALHAAFAVGATLRRALTESFTNLPAALGGEPVAPLLAAFSWATLDLTPGARPPFHLFAQAPDEAGWQRLLPFVDSLKDRGVAALQANPVTTAAAFLLAPAQSTATNPEWRLRLDLDFAQTVALIDAPLRLNRITTMRRTDITNLKQIGLALHNYHAAQNAFPPAYRADREHKPLLSWRVLILPELGEEALFREFHLDEVWNSPHNRALIPRMPKVYASPFQADRLTAEGQTTYLAPRGRDTILRNENGVWIGAIPDGLSNTIMALQVADANAVLWTRPDDITLDAPPPLGAERPVVLFGDGSVRRLADAIKPEVFRALLTTSGGEKTDTNDY